MVVTSTTTAQDSALTICRYESLYTHACTHVCMHVYTHILYFVWGLHGSVSMDDMDVMSGELHF